ncbi:MAG: hypothetical protein GXP30_09215 [Verrucomicrobia bacterium]|nr:hypothetical protein [Verrucomicrobiota bacterium]
MKLPAALALIITLIGIPAFADPGDKFFVELIGVAANTSKSSGGHSAIRIGGQVYQYQVARDKMLFLQRDPWTFFEHRYRKLDNRSLTLVRLDLSDEDAQRMHSRFIRLFVIQKKHVARWEALKIEKLWFDQLGSQRPAVPIPIVGCFDASRLNDAITQHLRTSAEKILGHDFIENGLKKVNATLQVNALTASRCGQNKIKIDAYPEVSEITAEQRLEQLSLREALIILKQGRAVSSALLIAPDDAPLSKHDRSQLKNLAQQIENSVSRLLNSSRPDRGEALLLATARYGALRQSLKQNRLLLLNVFPSKDKAITLFSAKETQRHRKLLTALSEQAGEIWNEERQRFMNAGQELTEYTYQRMENAAARYIEPRDAIRDGRALLSCSTVFLRPERDGDTTPLKLENFPPDKLVQAQQQSFHSYENFLANFRQSYGYSLFKHNCTTELADAIQSTFRNEQEIRASLGAVIDPQQGLTFIPARFTRKVQGRWKVKKTRTLPSYRLQRSAALITQSANPWIALRESNRLTSTVYPGSIHDDAFLFFSDGIPAWRPVQGASNLLFGLANVGTGLITSPLESGRLRMKRGINGMFYSLPEMFGISIRKGRYDILPRDPLDPP